MEPTTSVTCWTLIRGAARGHPGERERFATRYGGVIEACLRTRWHRMPSLGAEVDDARQEVLLECLREGGVLERVDPERGFRGFLHGVTRNVARRFEERGRRRAGTPPGPPLEELPDGAAEEAEGAFDRAWARMVMADAARSMARRAAALGAPARRRISLLRLRFQDGLPIREIATRWGLPAARVHKDYEKAREEFRSALREAVAFHLPDAPQAVDEECRRLLDLLH
jgi:RNA polymerase sigma-70 factor (ECF subfamily)